MGEREDAERRFFGVGISPADDDDQLVGDRALRMEAKKPPSTRAPVAPWLGVRVVDIDIHFWSMVSIFVRGYFAALVAGLIVSLILGALFVIGFVVLTLLGAFITGLASGM